MTWPGAIDRGLGIRVFDALFIAGVVLTSVLAWRGLRIAELGALPLVLLLLPSRWASVTRVDVLTIVLVGQHFLLLLVNAAVFAPRPDVVEPTPDDAISLWLGALIVFPLLLLRARQIADVSRLWRVLGPVALIASIACLAWEHFATLECRLAFLSRGPLLPPLWFTILTIATFAGWDRLTSSERALRYVLVALTVTATVGFAGARTMLLIQLICFPLLGVLLSWNRPWRRWAAHSALMGGALAAGLVAGLAFDQRADCGFGQRLLALFDVAEILFGDAPSPESSLLPPPALGGEHASFQRDIAPASYATDAASAASAEPVVREAMRRPEMWSDAVDLIRDRPLFGYGFVNEPPLAGQYPNFHQQYLSWLIWGGPLMLLSGLLMLVSPLLTFGIRGSRDASILALAIIAPVLLDGFAVTLFHRTLTVAGWGLCFALIYALAREARMRPTDRRSGP